MCSHQCWREGGVSTSKALYSWYTTNRNNNDSYECILSIDIYQYAVDTLIDRNDTNAVENVTGLARLSVSL